MPTYGYRCPSCGHDFDKRQKMSDQPIAACPECGKAAERLISGGVGIVFKGSGFYETDYKRAGESKTTEAGGKDKTSDKSDSGVKKDKPTKSDSPASKTTPPAKGSDS